MPDWYAPIIVSDIQPPGGETAFTVMFPTPADPALVFGGISL